MKDIYKEKTIEMKDETINEENKPNELSKEEIEIFEKFFKYYSLNEKNKIEDFVNNNFNKRKYTQNENQNLNNEIITNYKNKNESLGQIIDINELDKKGEPIFKKLEDSSIIYNGRLFILYPGISMNTKATYRCKFYRKNEKKLQEAGESKFCKIAIIYYYPSNKTKEKYILKNKISVSCDLLHAKSDENIITEENDWQKFTLEDNNLFNSKNYYYK